MRQHYHEELDDINNCLVEMANSVGSAMSKATTALLDADIELANLVIQGDEHIDATRESIEQRCFTLLARQAPVATDLRTITAAMRIISDLERMGDLAVHVAKLARMRFPEHAVPQELRPIFMTRIVADSGCSMTGGPMPHGNRLEASWSRSWLCASASSPRTPAW